MRNLIPKLKKAFPFLHERAATEDDFFEYCLRNNIGVIFDRDISAGVYVIYSGKSFIFLNGKLRGAMLLYVMFHELAHHLFHFPSNTSFGAEFFALDSKKKNHFEAEAVAALLLLPKNQLDVALQTTEYAQSDFAALVGFRVDLYDKYHV